MKVWYELARVYLIGFLVMAGFIGVVVLVTLIINNQMANLIAGIIFVGIIAPFFLGMIFSPDKLIRALEEKVKEQEKK